MLITVLSFGLTCENAKKSYAPELVQLHKRSLKMKQRTAKVHAVSDTMIYLKILLSSLKVASKCHCPSYVQYLQV